MKSNPIEEENKTPFFVFGKENRNRLIDLGFSCILIENKDMVFEGDSLFLHKMLAYQVAASMWDEFVYLDIDCHQTAPLPADFWESHQNKSVVQSPIYHKKHRHALWRKNPAHQHIIPCACYVYMRGKKTADQLRKKMERMLARRGKIENDEVVMAAFIDDLNGGVCYGLDRTLPAASRGALAPADRRDYPRDFPVRLGIIH